MDGCLNLKITSRNLKSFYMQLRAGNVRKNRRKQQEKKGVKKTARKRSPMGFSTVGVPTLSSSRMQSRFCSGAWMCVCMQRGMGEQQIQLFWGRELVFKFCCLSPPTAYCTSRPPTPFNSFILNLGPHGKRIAFGFIISVAANQERSTAAWKNPPHKPRNRHPFCLK